MQKMGRKRVGTSKYAAGIARKPSEYAQNLRNMRFLTKKVK